MKFESFETPKDISSYNIEGLSCSELSQRKFEQDVSELPKEPNEAIYQESFGNYLESLVVSFEHPEVLTDMEMTEKISDYLENVEDFRVENWCKLSIEQRTEVLNSVEQHIAVIEHRPALKVELEKLEPRHLGYQSASENKIVLNTLYVGSNDPKMHREVLDTIVHEGRHAYQHYNVDVKMIHESGSEVMTWAENFYNPEYQYYQSGTQKILIPYHDGSIHDVDYRLYYYQPVEIDARNFASEVLSKLEAKGVVCVK